MKLSVAQSLSWPVDRNMWGLDSQGIHVTAKPRFDQSIVIQMPFTSDVSGLEQLLYLALSSYPVSQDAEQTEFSRITYLNSRNPANRLLRVAKLYIGSANFLDQISEIPFAHTFNASRSGVGVSNCTRVRFPNKPGMNFTIPALAIALVTRSTRAATWLRFLTALVIMPAISPTL